MYIYKGLIDRANYIASMIYSMSDSEVKIISAQGLSRPQESESRHIGNKKNYIVNHTEN